MLFGTSTSLIAGIGEVTNNLINSMFSYALISLGIPLAFFIIFQLLSLFKGNDIYGVKGVKNSSKSSDIVNNKEYLNQSNPNMLPKKISVAEK